MLVPVLLCLTTATTAEPQSPAAEETSVVEPAPAEGEPVLERKVEGSPFLPKRSLETLRDLEPAAGVLPASSAAADPWLGAERPAFLRARHPGAAFALGGLVGFGAGYYYAAEADKGLFFSVLDTLLIGAYVGVTVALNDLVIEHDFRSGDALARGERDFGRIEARLYAAAILLGVAEGASRLFQGLGAMKAARRTNEALASFSFVPLPQGGGATLELTW